MSDERTATANDRRIGQRVRRRRLEIGMSQERLAEIIDVTFQQVQKYEKGVNRIASSRLFEISAALDQPIEWFYQDCDLANGARPPRIIEECGVTAESVELQRLFATIRTPVIRKRVVGLVRAVAETPN